MPASHVVQSRSVVAEGVLLTYVPAAHVVHATQRGAFASMLNVPLPSLATYCPAMHSAHAVHACPPPGVENVLAGHGSPLALTPPPPQPTVAAICSTAIPLRIMRA